MAKKHVEEERAYMNAEASSELAVHRAQATAMVHEECRKCDVRVNSMIQQRTREQTHTTPLANQLQSEFEAAIENYRGTAQQRSMLEDLRPDPCRDEYYQELEACGRYWDQYESEEQHAAALCNQMFIDKIEINEQMTKANQAMVGIKKVVDDKEGEIGTLRV